MRVIATHIPDVLLIEPAVHTDARGFFMQSFNQRDFNRAIGLDIQFVQDNHSRSRRNVLRGLHYQMAHAQGKLVRVVRGAIFDVAVDLRPLSPTLRQWYGVELNAQNHLQLWIPPGFAHGFLTLSNVADVLYKTTDYYAPGDEYCLRWNDPRLAIDWPLEGEPQLSAKDKSGIFLSLT